MGDGREEQEREAGEEPSGAGGLWHGVRCGHAHLRAHRAFPREERYSLTDQMRRSSRSVCANLAEAWRKRRYEAAFLLKLNDAEAEATETQTWLEFAVKSGYLAPEAGRDLYQATI